MDIETWKCNAQKLFEQLPKGYWLFAADGVLHVMKRDENGNRVRKNHGGMDQARIVGTLTGPEIDGGDW